MSTAIHTRVESCRAGDATVVARLPSGWAVMGSPQVVRGYCLLLPDPVVPSLNAMDDEARASFLLDMVRLGDAVLAATGCDRINYEILGNAEPALHAHVLPRREDEPEELRRKPVWFYDWSAAEQYDLAAHTPLQQAIRSALERP